MSFALKGVSQTSDKKVGEITHYYDQIEVAVIELVGPLSVGDRVKITGSTEFEQQINSMQADHKPIDKAGKGEAIGVKLDQAAKKGDEVFKID